jgi:hypothetical protein
MEWRVSWRMMCGGVTFVLRTARLPFLPARATATCVLPGLSHVVTCEGQTVVDYCRLDWAGLRASRPSPRVSRLALTSVPRTATWIISECWAQVATSGWITHFWRRCKMSYIWTHGVWGLVYIQRLHSDAWRDDALWANLSGRRLLLMFLSGPAVECLQGTRPVTGWRSSSICQFVCARFA